MPDIYQGPDSCYGRREGVYVPGKGVSAGNARRYAELILRDLHRGWTYDHSCRRIRMTPRLAVKRLRFLIRLARMHRGEEEARRVARVVARYIRAVRKWVRAHARGVAKA